MIKISFWTNGYERRLNNKRPQRYMCGWSFEKLLNYIKGELEYMEININEVDCISLKGNNWQQSKEKKLNKENK